MSDFTFKRKDTGKPLRVRVTEDGLPVDLSDMQSIEFHMGGIVHGTASVVDAENGIIEYDWNDGDTDVSGLFKSNFRLIPQDGKPLSYPRSGYINILIMDG